MKMTYFYSEKQMKILLEHKRRGTYFYEKREAPNGRVYTEVISIAGEHKSNFDDAVVVCETTGHNVDQFLLRVSGKEFAE